jgi:hypothetical protein
MATRRGMMKGRGKGYKNVISKDPVVHRMSAKGMKQPQKIGMIDKFANELKPRNIYLPFFVNKDKLSESEILLLKRRLNDKKIKHDEIFKNKESFKLTEEQEKKGIGWLRKQWKTPNGVERKNNPFGAREEYVLDNFDHFELVDFYNNVNYLQSQSGLNNYVPYYRVVAKDGSYFEYWVGYQDRNQTSPVNIWG